MKHETENETEEDGIEARETGLVIAIGPATIDLLCRGEAVSVSGVTLIDASGLFGKRLV